MDVKKINQQDIETIGRLLGVPGTGQVAKYIRRRQQGMSHAEAIIGMRTDIQKKKEKQQKGKKTPYIY